MSSDYIQNPKVKRLISDLAVKDLKVIAQNLAKNLPRGEAALPATNKRSRKTISRFTRPDLVEFIEKINAKTKRLTKQLLLKNAIKKAIRKETIDERKKRMDIVKAAVGDSDVRAVMLKNGRSVRVIQDRNGKLVAYELRRIGSPSKNGSAHLFALGDPLSNGTSLMLKSLVTFAVKLSNKLRCEGDFDEWLASDTHEKKMLQKCTDIVLQGKFPNFPIMYSHQLADIKSQAVVGTKFSEKSVCFYTRSVIVNEVASRDLTKQIYINTGNVGYAKREYFVRLILQGLVAISGFHHYIGYPHNDAHTGNFLVHEIQPGGQWHYKIHGKDLYIVNTGQQVVIWDPLSFSARNMNGKRIGNVTGWTSGKANFYNADDYRKFLYAVEYHLKTQTLVSADNIITGIMNQCGDLRTALQTSATPADAWRLIHEYLDPFSVLFRTSPNQDKDVINKKPYVVG